MTGGSPLAFKLGLYAEHLEEVGFLYGQCKALRADAEQGWLACAPFEERLEAHLDALVVGGKAASTWCLDQLPSAEPEALFGITALLCRSGNAAALKHLLQDERLGDLGALEAIAAALLQEWPSAWKAGALRALAEGDLRLAPTFAAIACSRGWDVGAALVGALERSPPAAQPALLEWLGRMPGQGWPGLAQACEDAEPRRRTAALLAGLRQHDPGALALVLADTAEPGLLAMAGGRGTAARLTGLLADARRATAAAAALGQIGELSAVRTLTALLADDTLAGTAACALQLITGADLRETVLVPEPVDEAEMTPAELQRWRSAGEAPRRLDGEPFGSRVERPCRDPAIWGGWLMENGARFSAQLRYRHGAPCSAVVLVRSLGHPAMPASARTVLAEELIVRHGIRCGWNAATTVAQQWGALRQAMELAESDGSEPGSWAVPGARRGGI